MWNSLKREKIPQVDTYIDIHTYIAIYVATAMGIVEDKDSGDASKMLEAALQQMDGIINGT